MAIFRVIEFKVFRMYRMRYVEIPNIEPRLHKAFNPVKPVICVRVNVPNQ